jgi:imidazolonepropionase-like amidohydrolase
VHHELYLFVKKCGFSPAEALRAATYLNAKRFKFSDRGEIKAGLRADLVLIEGNPLENIDDTLNLRGVWKEGVLCKTYEGLL